MGWFGIFLVAVLLTSCGGGGGGSNSDGGTTTTPSTPPAPPLTTLSGTAAAGAPIQGTVNLRDSAGTTRTQTINANGEFLFDLNGLTAPYLLWADGMANAKEAFFYSMATEGGRANVTPATHCIMAMALGKNPVSYYRENPSAAPPDTAGIDAAKQKLAALFSKLFETTGVPTGFDLMTGQFAADGTRFDSIMDVVEMNADEEFVDIMDRGSNTALFKQELASGTVSGQETPEKVNELCMAGKDVLKSVRTIFQTLQDQFATARPSYDDLLTVMQPLMSDEFRDQGVDREQLIKNMADGAPIGLKFENVALYRKMKTHTLADFASPISEIPTGYSEGIWCTYTYKGTNRASYNIGAFVRETTGSSWKWHGDQNPFQSGGFIEAESAWWMRRSPGLRIYSGLRFRTEDTNSSALNRYGVTQFMVLNSALPEWTAPSGNSYNALILTKDTDPSLSYNITSTGRTWRARHFEKDGLDINAITNKEFVFIGFDSSNNPVHIWIDLLDKKPVQEAVLWKDTLESWAAGEFSSYFSELLSIWGETSEIYMPPSSTNPSSIPLQWEVALNGVYVEYTEAYWMDSMGAYVRKGASNPAVNDSSLNLEDWTSTTLDISALSNNWPPTPGIAGIAYSWLQTRDEFERRYETETDFIFADFPVPPIQITGQNLHYRNYIDTSKNRFRGFIDFTNLGYPIADGDIQEIRLINVTAGGTQVPIDKIAYDSNFYLWNGSATSPLGPAWEIIYYSQYAVWFPTGASLPPATYRYEVVTKDADVLTSGDIDFIYEVIPAVDVASMKSEWMANGDLKLSWTLPVGASHTQQRIWITDDSGSIILIGLNAALMAQEVTIPKKVIESSKILKAVDTPNWQIQLRYTATGNSNQSARGMSDRVPIADWK
jgi:hypothetical protein